MEIIKSFKLNRNRNHNKMMMNRAERSFQCISMFPCPEEEVTEQERISNVYIHSILFINACLPISIALLHWYVLLWLLLNRVWKEKTNLKPNIITSKLYFRAIFMNQLCESKFVKCNDNFMKAIFYVICAIMWCKTIAMAWQR